MWLQVAAPGPASVQWQRAARAGILWKRWLERRASGQKHWKLRIAEFVKLLGQASGFIFTLTTIMSHGAAIIQSRMCFNSALMA